MFNSRSAELWRKYTFMPCNTSYIGPKVRKRIGSSLQIKIWNILKWQRQSVKGKIIFGKSWENYLWYEDQNDILQVFFQKNFAGDSRILQDLLIQQSLPFNKRHLVITSGWLDMLWRRKFVKLSSRLALWKPLDRMICMLSSIRNVGKNLSRMV